MSDVADVVRERLRTEHLQGRDDLELTEDVNLIDEEVLDSLGIFLLVEFLQERYGVVIGADEVTIENFETIAAIDQLVNQLRARGVR